MADNLSNTQIDRLGDRLRKGPVTEQDLRQLEAFKQSFGSAYQTMLEVLKRHVPSVKGRPEKSTLSIVAKLRRENTRLSRMQDIAGCRAVVKEVLEQDTLVGLIKQDFPTALVKDRRKTPSHGYRAVHLVVQSGARLVEIQVRTELQHVWAELSEKAADALGIELKYGGGDEFWKRVLVVLSDLIRSHETTEALNPELETHDRESREIARQLMADNPDIISMSSSSFATPPDEILSERQKIMEIVRSLMLSLEKQKGAK